MKKEYIIHFFLILILITSCENFFTGNIFSALDKPSIKLNNADDILKNLDSLDMLSEEEAKEAIATLQSSLDTLDPDADPALYQETALALADLSLSSSGADDTINNMAPLFSETLSDPSAFLQNPDTFIATMFPEDASTDEISTQLAAMMGAAGAIESYGTTLDSSDGTELSATEKGDLAMQAVISGSVDSLITQNMEENGASEEEAIADLADYIKSTQTGEEDPENPYNDIHLDGDFLSPSISSVASDGGIDL